MRTGSRLNIAVVGSGISGLSAAWLLSQRHDVTLYERAGRIGGHSNTVVVKAGESSAAPVDTGFIVFNRKTYPNLSALFDFLGVATEKSEMSFAVSLDNGALEYSGSGLLGLFGQPKNLLRPRFWSMLADIIRFYWRAPQDADMLDEANTSLGRYLAMGRYGEAFKNDHLLPMASAIWSASPHVMQDYPAAAFIRFHQNHGLLQFTGRPAWETVVGGSRNYVARLVAPLAGRVRTNRAVKSIRRAHDHVAVTDDSGVVDHFDHVVISAHADDALSMLADPDASERNILGSFRYSRNHAVLHTDESFMPKRRPVWSSWNFIGEGGGGNVCVTYWMNRLQNIESEKPLLVTLNPPRPPRAMSLLHSEIYTHPIFDAMSMAAQRKLWSLQGRSNTWFCGSYFGAGFHEDGLQAGLAVAEQLGNVRRPWNVQNESGRIVLSCMPATAKNVSLSA